MKKNNIKQLPARHTTYTAARVQQMSRTTSRAKRPQPASLQCLPASSQRQRISQKPHFTKPFSFWYRLINESL